jgi:thiol-disulfide isomerase/thioredoxin
VKNTVINFMKKNLSNILFIGFIIFLFTPYGLPVRALLIKGVSMVTTRIFSLETDADKRVQIDSYQWTLQDISGEKVNFGVFENKVVVLNFWATWCPPCIAEMPGFQELNDLYKDQVSFLFVTSDEKKRVNQFMKDKRYTFPVYFQVSPSPEPLKSNSLPTTYIIDQQGMVVVDKVGAADWNSAKVHRILDHLLQ